MFPDHCLRGIPNDSYITEDGSIGPHLFYFEYPPRNDGLIELSINWEDDAHALVLIFNQKKPNGDFQFKSGVVKIPRDELDRLNRRPTIAGVISYERNQLPDNPYHGNILLRSEVSKLTMKTIAAGIALAVSEVIGRS